MSNQKYEITAQEMLELNKLNVIKSAVERKLHDITDSEVENSPPAIRDVLQVLQFWITDTSRTPTR